MIGEALAPLRGHWARALRGERWRHVPTALSCCAFTTLVTAHLGASLGWVALTGVTCLLLSALGSLWLLHPAWRRIQSPSQTAALAEELSPNLGSAAKSAVELAHKLANPSDQTLLFSTPLAKAHVGKTVERLGQIDFAPLIHTSRRGPAKQALWVGLVSLTVIACSIWALERGRTRLGNLVLEPGGVELSEVPLLGDIRLTYQFPAYTGRKAKVIEGSDGSITATKGSLVQIEATADTELESAKLIILSLDGTPTQTIPVELGPNRKIATQLSVLQDGRYRIEVETSHGLFLREQRDRPISASPDAYPQIILELPAEDVELRDNQSVTVLWRAQDDFGVATVHLVVDTGRPEPTRIPLGSETSVAKRRTDRYTWSVAGLEMDPSLGAEFFIEVTDNDTVSGPKKATSATRKLVVFSAKRFHEELLAEQQALLDTMVDLLGDELTSQAAQASGRTSNVQQLLTTHKALLEAMSALAERLSTLQSKLATDQLTPAAARSAFGNVFDHLTRVREVRRRAIAATQRQLKASLLIGPQQFAIDKLERDIVYLDDFLALSRIDALKDTARELLSSQRELEELLDEYRQSGDERLKSALEQQIDALRKKMLELLQKMAQIKKGLPGEYRNMEAASMLQVDDQLEKLEKMLNEGDLEAAARELEQLANTIENMVDSIQEAEKEYGGDKYEAVREELEAFADEFQRLEEEQDALAQGAEELLERYRDETMKRVGNDVDRFIEELTELVDENLRTLDTPSANPKLSAAAMRQLSGAREKLLDLKLLLEQRDFFESRDVATAVQRHTQNLERMLSRRKTAFKPQGFREEDAKAAKVANSLAQKVLDRLKELFPEPEEVLSPREASRMESMADKQQALETKAGEVAKRMEKLAQELPIFGREPRQELSGARQEMRNGEASMRDGELPSASQSKRRAADALKKLRKALEESARGQGGGMPLPLGGGQPRRDGRGTGRNLSHDDVELPQAETGRGGPSFRKELLEAAKQKAPKDYEDAVRRYYEELIK